MIDHKQELYEDLDQLRDYALTVKRAATDMLDWIHVIETDMQMFIDDYAPGRFPDIKPEPVTVVVDGPIEPGSPCIDPDGAGCRCYEGCTADCLPSEYQSCKCPRKIHKSTLPEPEPEANEPIYTLTDKGKLIVQLIDEGYKYLDACRIAEGMFDKE